MVLLICGSSAAGWGDQVGYHLEKSVHLPFPQQHGCLLCRCEEIPLHLAFCQAGITHMFRLCGSNTGSLDGISRHELHNSIMENCIYLPAFPFVCRSDVNHAKFVCYSVSVLAVVSTTDISGGFTRFSSNVSFAVD